MIAPMEQSSPVITEFFFIILYLYTVLNEWEKIAGTTREGHFQRCDPNRLLGSPRACGSEKVRLSSFLSPCLFPSPSQNTV